MKNYLKICLLILVILVLAPQAVLAEKSKQNKPEDKAPKTIADLQKKQTEISNELNGTIDPKKRKELINKLRKINALYYDPEFRAGANKKSSESRNRKKDNAKELEEYKGEFKPQIATGAIWESYSVENRIKICAKVKKECEEKKSSEQCRFFVSKCKKYVDRKYYEDFVRNLKSQTQNNKQVPKEILPENKQ